MYFRTLFGGLAAIATAMPALAQEVKELPEMVVSASRVPVPADSVGSAVTVIEREDIQRKQVRLLSDILREVPGVALSRGGPVGSLTQVRIRGAEANQTLVLIDGVEVNDPSGASEFDLSTILADDVQRIEVLRGPQSALYGSDAIGGVINIITIKGEGGTSIRARVEGGSFNTLNATAGVSGADGAVDYALGVSGFRTAGVSAAPKSQGNTERDGYENLTASAKLGWQANEILEFELFGRVMDSEIESDPQPAVAGVIRVVDGDVLTTSDQFIGRAQAGLTLFDGAWERRHGC
ncbi:MAG: TonB-dependent receptor [Alphaproteobacteria bacterium]